MFVCAECGASQAVPGHCGADGAPLAPVGEDMLLGTTIGAYRVARLLGVGGMGRVYKGVHPQIGSRVAIKVLSRECSDRRDLVDRFFAEAKAVNVIRHESIVNVLDLATLPDGRPYIVMEYLDGSSLAAIIDHAKRSGVPMPIGGVARLTVEVLDALAAAHGKGIVHRDLKPDNIYVTPAGRAKVLDFGIAKLQPELGGSSTHTGSLLGTPHYMSPEQAAGRPVDLRADLYANGVILFECTTLQKPFIAPVLFDLLRMHIEAPPPSPRALRRDLPEGVEHVIFAALAKLADQRFASAQAMSMALQHATAQLPADQWAPVQPATSSRPAPAGGWAPTPPASWAGGARSHAVSHSTQTAGQVAQVAPPPRAGSRKALWVGLGALLLVGGGITAAVLASRGDNDKPPAPGIATATTGDAALAETPPVDPAPIPIPIPTNADPWSGELPPHVAAQMDQVMEQTLAALPPQARSGLPPALNAAIKKYGRWSKIPDAERKQLLDGLIGGGFGGLGAMGGQMDVISSALSGEEPPASPKGPDGWIQYSTLALPGTFNAKRVEAMKHQAWAIDQAKQLFPDAVLFRIDATGIFPDGHADFTAVDNGGLGYRFIVPSRAKRDPKKPIGAKQELKCAFMITIGEDGAHVTPMDGVCDEKPIGPPRCSLVQAWKKAISKKAPSNAIAALGYRADFDGKPTWYFNIYDDVAPFSVTFPDDC